MSEKDEGIYSGLLTALICISLFDQPVIVEEIMGTLDEKGREELVQFAQRNGEFELSGLDKYVARKQTNTTM